MRFQLYNCDAGVKINGVSYAFDHVQSVVVEDPEMNKLTRGANAGNKTGLAYKEGLKEPKRLTFTIMNMSMELKAVLDSAFADQTRLEPYVINRDDGSSKIAKEAILCQLAMQKNLDESAESLNVELVFESYDLNEVHKS